MGNFLQDFKKRLNKKEIKICIVGLGYVGLPLAIEFAKKGFAVLGIDIDRQRLEHLKKKESYITDISGKELKRVLASGKFTVAGEFHALKSMDVVIICVPTPLKRKYHPNISYIKQAVKSIAKNMKAGTLIVLESTTYPGTTEEVILPLLKKNNLKHNRDFYLSFSPERIDPGNKHYPVHKIPKIVGGVSPQATELAALVYGKIIDKVVPVSSARTAEAAKLLENTFRLINIGMIDELAMMAHKMKINIWEVIEAASTKPFGFTPFYPGPGVGGHCLDKSETVFVKDGDLLKALEMPDFVEHLRGAQDRDIEVLSFDPLKKRSVFKKVTAASARPYSGPMVNIVTEDGRRLRVTDLHPMFLYNNGSWRLKYAKDLQKGDFLPLSLELPDFTNRHSINREIDVLEQIRQKGQNLIDKIRVKPVGFSWKEYAEQIKSVLRKGHNNKLPAACRDYLSDNVLPLKYFYLLEKLTAINHDKIKLITGRGPAYREFPVKITLDRDFCRLIGYYLSEGCYTKDKSARIRFSFNRGEKEYIDDVINILRRLGIRSSVYESKRFYASCIKVSSDIFGFLIYRILDCGNNCYNMKMPERIFSLGKEEKSALLAGLFRGDACVEHFFGKWRYRKNQKQYFHKVNTASISFYTSSRKLSQQLVILLHDLRIVPTFGKRKYSLSIYGYKKLEFFKDIFDGKKKKIIARYLELSKSRPRNKTFRRQGSFATVKLKEISFGEGGMVYSLETTKPHSFVTSYGIAVHNCIPKDPLYLHWKAKHFGFRSRFIKLASDVITQMPEYVVHRVEEALKNKGIELRDARILVVGVTYKRDVKDLRKSPSIDIIDILQKRNVRVSYFDPLIPFLRFNHIDLKSIKLNKLGLKDFDCVVIATGHTKVDYNLILKNANLIFDSRNVYKGKKNIKVVTL